MAVVLDTGTSLTQDVVEQSQVGAARRLAARVAEGAGVSETVAGQFGLIAVELATNLVKHARHGALHLRGHGTGADAVLDAVSIDRGPGMDLEACFRDGFSTSGTSGTGLGAVRRLATAFDAYADGHGSVVFARLGVAHGPARGVVATPIRGETVSGDQWQLLEHGTGWSLAVVDGLGHGREALEAARAVLDAHTACNAEPQGCLELAHARTGSTRGAACTVATFDAGSDELRFAGVGNIATVLVGRDSARGVASQNGTLGATCPRIRPSALDLAGARLLVMHTDGLSGRWSLDHYPGLRFRHPQVIAAVLYRDACRQRDDATVVVVQLQETRA